MIKRCEKIIKAYDNIQELAKFLKVEQDSGEAQLSNPDDGFTSVAEYENMMIRIIRADKRGLLLLHPYVVRRIEQRLQSYWLNLAKSAGMKFFSVMTMPDEHFAKYYTVNADGRIVGDKLFCAPDFQEGLYIVFCNPMRHWGDVQLWRNVYEGDYLGDTGILATGKDLLLSLGRDTDGDYVQIAFANHYPHIKDAIMAFDESPVTKKLPKVPLKGDLRKIALGSMNDLTGVVASLLGRSTAVNVGYHVLEIPAFPPYQSEPEERRIIDFLSQELQIAVDSIKSAYPNHTKGLDVVKGYLDDLGAPTVNEDGEPIGSGINTNIPWLADFKNPDCYKTRPCAVDEDATDTISRLVRLVNSYFTAPSLSVNTDARDYVDTLFSDVEPTQFQLNYALSQRNEYWAEMKIANDWKNNNEGDTTKIREVSQRFKASLNTVLELTDNGELFTAESWASAYWKVSHMVNSGDAGFVFAIFPDEIIMELQNMKDKVFSMIEVYAVQFSPINKHKWEWNGEDVMTRVYLKNINGKQGKAVEFQWNGVTNPKFFGFQHLGMIGQKTRGQIAIGETKKMKIYTIRFKLHQGQIFNSSVLLFEMDYPQDEINKIVEYFRNKNSYYL
ncbi:MAG: hypothetical protein FWJ34_00575 [Geminocystis sp. GBBB08]|nr:hypothetical protein [Geminocystis sp. GBBB08]